MEATRKRFDHWNAANKPFKTTVRIYLDFKIDSVKKEFDNTKLVLCYWSNTLSQGAL